MIYFGIPLRSKYSSINWERVCTHFNRTLKSVFNQTRPEFKIIVACHEIPLLDREYDDRVEFNRVDIPYPKDLKEQMADKGYKVHLIGKRIREYGGGFTMIVDADDLISNRLVQFVEEHPENQFGWYIDSGYTLYLDKMRLNFAPKFPSGSNTIINYTIEMLPPDLENAWKPSRPENECIIIRGHSTKVKKESCKELGRPLSPIPFKAAVYVLGTGENHSTLSGFRSPYRALLDLVITRRRLSKQIRDEFGIHWCPERSRT
jgi:hypothetical protein